MQPIWLSSILAVAVFITNMNCKYQSVLLATFMCAATAVAQENAPASQILELKNGDRITVTVQSQTEGEIVVVTPFGNMTIPMEQVLKLSPVPSAEAEAAPAEPEVTATPAPTDAAEAAEAAEETKQEPTTFAGKMFSNFAGEFQVGLDAGSGASDYLNYFGRLHATHGYDRWNNIWDGKLTYGKNKGEIAANKLDTSYRLEYDAIKDKLFLYGEPTGGYDKIREIDYFYTIGGGLGYHVLKTDKMALNFSAGASYQYYKYQIEGGTGDMFIDFGEDFAWEIIKDLKFVEKFTISPKAKDWNVFRFTLEAGLSWAFYKNMSFNFTAIDKYESHPAASVDKNDLQIVTSIGIKF